MDAKIKTKAESQAATHSLANETAHTHASVANPIHPHPKVHAKAKKYANTRTKIRAKSVSDADPYSKVLIPLYNLAADCLRLSMHFFHPIQQCAQQVYHTAVPLSPTSSQLRKSCLQSIVDNQLSHVTAFLGAPHTWGLLLRTIDTRPKKLNCIATSGQMIISACEDIVNIYDAVTGVLQQSICVTEMVVKIKPSPNGTILFLAHSSSVTMLDVQTGGLIHTFTAQSEINDIAVSTTHIACGSSDGLVIFWDIHTKEGGECFGNGQPVVNIYWSSPQDLVVATQGTLYTHNIIDGTSSVWFFTPGSIWGMVYLENEFLVGTTWQVQEVGQKQSFFVSMSDTGTLLQWELPDQPHVIRIDGDLQLWLSEESVQSQVYAPFLRGKQSENPTLVYSGQLKSPTLVGKEIACITPATGVQLFNTSFHCWTKSPPLLGAARSVTMSLGRNIVAQIDNSIQIFSADILTGGEAHRDTHTSHVYPLGEEHMICIQLDKHLILLKLETMEELHPDSTTSPPGCVSPPANQPPFAYITSSRGLVARFDILSAMQAWKSSTPLHKWTEAVDGDAPLSGLSPMRTRVVTVHRSPRLKLTVEDVEGRSTIMSRPLEYDDFGEGTVCDLGFDSETSFYLKIDEPGRRIQVPYNIIPSSPGRYSHTIARGEPVLLSEPRATLPYTLDANCKWVLDPESRKICWIPPGNLRRGYGGHFWAGLSLVMVGDDGAVRKLSFREPGSQGVHGAM